MTRPDRPPFIEAVVAELLRAAEPFSMLCDPPMAPDDGYEPFGPGGCRITFGQVRRLRAAIDAIRDEWRDDDDCRHP